MSDDEFKIICWCGCNIESLTHESHLEKALTPEEYNSLSHSKITEIKLKSTGKTVVGKSIKSGFKIIGILP